MSEQDSRRQEKRYVAPVRVKVKYADHDSLSSHFCRDVSESGMFIRAKSPAAIGTMVRVDYALADGGSVLKGMGEVRWVRSEEEAAPGKPAGMGIALLKINESGRRFFQEMVAEGKIAPPAWLGRMRGKVAKKIALAQHAREANLSADVAAELAHSVLVIDLSGAEMLAALAVPSEAGLDAGVPNVVTPKLAAPKGELVRSGEGTWVPALPRLAEVRCPSANAELLSRLLSVPLIDDGSGAPGLRLDDTLVSVSQALKLCLDDLVEPYCNSGMLPSRTRVIYPSNAGASLVAAVAGTLATKGLTDVAPIAAGAAAFAAAQQPADLTALILRPGLLETTGDLVHGADGVLQTVASCETSLLAADDAIAHIAAGKLGIDSEKECGLVMELRNQVTDTRMQEVEGPWSVEARQASAELSFGALQQALFPQTEKVVQACQQLLRAGDLEPGALGAFILAADEPTWPGLVQALEQTLGQTAVLLGSRAWNRINGVARLLSAEGQP